MIPRLNQIFRETIDLIRDELDVVGRTLRRLRQDMALYFVAAYRINRYVTTFMTKHGVPGMSLAIAYKGQLVFRKGYGFADASTNEPVTIDHLFRIASLSKPITSAAVFKLHQERRVLENGRQVSALGLDEKVFGPGGVLGTKYGTPKDPDINQITVQHLLEHTSGWSNTPRDIMIDPDPAMIAAGLNWKAMTKDDLIKWMVANRKLAHKPGDTYEYLNFGYLVLGRVIEARSGMSYADYVRQEVLAPCGISDMHIAGDTLAERRPNEVHYYESSWDPYSILVSRMDAHGGWIASPTDYLRFLVRVDGFPTPPDILTSASIDTMVTPNTATDSAGPPLPSTVKYAKGWYVGVGDNNRDNYWHPGELPGTIALCLRTTDEYCFVVLANSHYYTTHPTVTTSDVDDIDRLFWQIKNEEGKSTELGWPTGTPL
jgi:CubicO group peptidase (beta-lactamase class C family)